MTIDEAITILSLLKYNEGVQEHEQNVDALILTISALENQQKWIPVTERLPDDDETVLVYKPLAKGTTIEIQVTQGWCINPSIMSHWMPLPKPPKEEST